MPCSRAQRPIALALLALAAEPSWAVDVSLTQPNFQLEGKTDGAAEARATIGVRVPASAGGEWVLRGNARVATKDGFARLFGLKSGELSLGNDWKLGLSATYASFNLDVNPIVNNEARDAALVAGTNICIARCRVGAENDEAFCKAKATLEGKERKSWVHSLVLGEDLPATFEFEGQVIAPQRLSYRVEHVWTPTLAGVKKWRRAAAYCDETEARKIFDRLEPFVSDASLGEEVINEKIRAAEGQLSTLLEGCLAPCSSDVLPTPAQWKFCQSEPRFELPDNSKPDLETRLCPTGKDELNKQTRKLALSAYPSTLLNFGVVAGQTYMSYLVPSGATSTMELKRNASRPLANLGVSATRLLAGTTHTLSIEGRAGWALGWEAASAMVRWCTPTAGVNLGGPAHVAPGESCSEGVLGSPTRVSSLSAAAYAGVLDTHESVYRASLGIEAQVPTNDPMGFKFTLTAPTYFAFAGKEKDAYKGLLRIAPSVTFANAPDANAASGSSIAMTVGVSLTLLGERLLFSEEFDKL